MNKKADILHEHVIFIVLNVVFFAIMLVFIYLQSSSVHLMEEETAKQIALLIDVAKPGTDIEINLNDFFEKAEKNGINRLNSIEIDKDKNLVIVRGNKDSFYEYGYFNEEVDFAYSPKGDYLVLSIIEPEEKQQE